MREVDPDVLEWAERVNTSSANAPEAVAPGTFTPTEPGTTEPSNDWRAALEFDPTGSRIRDGDTDYAAGDLARTDADWARWVAHRLETARKAKPAPAADINNEACALLLAGEEGMEGAISLLKAAAGNNEIAARNLETIERHLGVEF